MSAGRMALATRQPKDPPLMPEITSAAIIDALLAIVGANGVLHGEDDTAGFLSDWHNRYHGKAHAVVLPETTDQVAAIMA